jgi:hypothetical protein
LPNAVTIEIEIGDAIVRVGPGVDPAFLSEVIRLLKAAAWSCRRPECGCWSQPAQSISGAAPTEGAENWAMPASLIETCKLHRVNPQAYLTDVLTKLVNNWPNRRLAELTPWAWTGATPWPAA